MIRWLSTLPFFRDFYRLGGTDAMPIAIKDVKEMVRDDIEAKAEVLAKQKLADLLTVIDERFIITFNAKEKAVYIGGQKVNDPNILQNLKQESEALLNFDLWKILNETPKRLAQKALFEDDGKSEIIHAKGRSMLYLLDTQNRILATLKSYEKK